MHWFPGYGGLLPVRDEGGDGISFHAVHELQALPPVGAEAGLPVERRLVRLGAKFHKDAGSLIPEFLSFAVFIVGNKEFCHPEQKHC